MANTTADRFAEALQKAEQTNDVQPLIEMFAEDAVLSSPMREADLQGLDQIRNFWRHYLDTFQQIHSEFYRIHETGDIGVLEWESQGVLSNGGPFKYRGVSLLDLKDNRVQRFATYFDTAALVTPPPVRH